MSLRNRPHLPELKNREAQKILEAANREGKALHDVLVMGAVEKLWWLFHDLEAEIVRIQTASD